MKVGYARTTSVEEKFDEQIFVLKEIGAQTIFFETALDSSKKDQELSKMLSTLQAGDTVIIQRLSRLSNKLSKNLRIIEEISKCGSDIRSIEEQWLDTTGPSGNIVFLVLTSLAEFERKQISDRTKAGLTLAREKGRRGGRPPIEREEIEKILEMHNNNQRVLDIQEATKLSRGTIYKYINMERKRMRNKKMTVVNFFDTEALLSYEHLKKEDIPIGFNKYDIRHGEDWEPRTVEVKVRSNFLGSILTPLSLKLDSKNCLKISITDFGYLSEELTPKQFMTRYGNKLKQEPFLAINSVWK